MDYFKSTLATAIIVFSSLIFSRIIIIIDLKNLILLMSFSLIMIIGGMLFGLDIQSVIHKHKKL